jgi:hypothetical protein
LADLTLIQLQDAWMVERNADYRAIPVILEAESTPVTPPTAAPDQEQGPFHQDPIAKALFYGAFGALMLLVAYLVGKSNSAPAVLSSPPPVPPPVIVVPSQPQPPQHRCLLFCFGG